MSRAGAWRSTKSPIRHSLLTTSGRPTATAISPTPACCVYFSRLRATAPRTRFFSAFSLILSPSLMSMARRTFPSRLELKRPGRIVERSALVERQLDGILVGLAGADAPVVGPDRNSGVRGFHPLPLLDDVGIGFSDDSSHLAERLAAPVAQLLDPLVHLFRSIRHVARLLSSSIARIHLLSLIPAPVPVRVRRGSRGRRPVRCQRCARRAR